MERIFANVIAPCVMAAVLCAPVLAATNNGCDDEDNAYIAPELALCSTHVYNIGQTENPSDESTRAAMREVVALKTTLMTQQMKQQYDYLEATIRRFKTQLEKAILTTSLQAAGASDEDSGTIGGAFGRLAGTGNPNTFLSGAKDCGTMGTTAEVFACLRDNYNVIYNMSNGGKTVTNEIKKQLATDCNTMTANYAEYTTMPSDCKDSKTIKTANAKTCLTHLIGGIRGKLDQIEKDKMLLNKK